MAEISIRKPHDAEGMERFVELMEGSFDLDDRVSVLPKHMFIALRNTGCLLGAYTENSLVGFICWWPDPTTEGSIYSHAIAVDRDHRGKGIGEKLLFGMQASAEGGGYRSVWGTFDPLKSYLAQLYVKNFGVTVSEYRNDYYGSLGAEELSGETPTDRFVAVKDFGVERKEKNREEITGVHRILQVDKDGVSVDVDNSDIDRNETGGEWRIERNISEDVLGIEIPNDFSKIKDTGTEIDWRYATRKIFTELLSKNEGSYTVAGFLHNETGKVNECTYILVNNSVR